MTWSAISMDQKWAVQRPLVHLFEPETAHRLAVRVMTMPQWVRRALGVVPDEEQRRVNEKSSLLRTSVWGISFSNPVGDKHGEAIVALGELGLGCVEIGSVTPKPQEGNPQPRVFRLVEDRAVINRYGFNSDGHEVVKKRLEAFRLQHPLGSSVPLGVNLGKNKTSEDAAQDYVDGVKLLGPYADYIVINISSPNTPGLRALQGRKQLVALVKSAQEARDAMVIESHRANKPPLLVKIAPDLDQKDIDDIASVALQLKVDGVIVSNTTISRPESLQDKSKIEAGGLSGAPLFEMSTQCLAKMYRATKGKIPLIGVGGISSGEQTYAKIRAGASLVQLYSSMVFEGPPLISRINQELEACLRRDGFSNISDAIGVDAKR
jgi:dihydroorotate dehydrogenase